MANILVTSSFTIEQAIAQANSTLGNDIIRFDPSLVGQTLYISNTLQITQGTVTIDGDIDGDFNIDIKISGDQGVIGVFSDDLAVLLEVQSGATANLKNIEFRDAYSRGADGHYDATVAVEAESARAGILNAGTLYVSNSVFSDFYARGGDGYAFAPAHYAESGAGSAEAGIINSGTLNLYQAAIENLRAKAGAKANVPGGNDGGSAITGLIQDAGTTHVSQSVVSNVYVRPSGAQDGGAGPGGDGALAFSLGINRVGDASSMTGAINQNGSNVFGDPYPGNGTPVGQFGGFGDFFGDASFRSWGDRSTSGDDNFTWPYRPTGSLYGLQGDDVIVDGAGGSHIFGGSGDDQLTVYGWDPAAYGQTGNDIIFAQGFYAGHMATLDGGVGTDILDLHLISAQSFNIDLEAGTIKDSGASTLGSAANFESVIGTDYAGAGDTLLGSAGDESLRGLAGDDLLSGRAGRDVLFGGSGNDRIKGEDDNDKLFGDDGDDLARGGGGNDKIQGGANNDRLFGDRGDDIVKGGTGDDVVRGGANNDKLYGDKGDDTIEGGSGDDRIEGGKGNDKITSGGGRDILMFGKRNGTDLVEDYKDGKDRFDLKAFGFSSKAKALKHFFEIGGQNNDVVGFHANGTDIKIKGADLKDIDVHDIII